MAQVTIRDDVFDHLKHIAEKFEKSVEEVIHPILKNYIIEVEGTEHIAEDEHERAKKG